jgi:hypothetical protein
MVAYAFLQYRRLKTPKREKKNRRTATSADTARRRQAILELIGEPPKQLGPHCRKWICNEQRRE